MAEVKELARKTLELMHTDLSEDDTEGCIDYAVTLHELGMTEREAVITACKEFLLLERSI